MSGTPEQPPPSRGTLPSGAAPAVVPAGSSELVGPTAPPCLCPGIKNWGPALMVKMGRSVSQLLALEVCLEPSQLGGALQRLYQSAAPCNVFGMWITPGYFPEELAKSLNEWWPTLGAEYWDVLSWRHHPRASQEYEVATLPLTTHYPGYLDRQTQQFKPYCMARMMTIVNFSGAAVVIDLYPYKYIPAGLPRFLDNPRVLKAAFHWPQDSQALSRRCASTPAARSVLDLVQLPGGWMASAATPLTSLRDIVDALMATAGSYEQFRAHVRYYSPTQTLSPMIQQNRWDSMAHCTGNLALWLLDLAVLNYSPADVRLDGASDPITTAFHGLLMTHYVQHRTQYLPTATDANTLCNLYRGPQLGVTVQQTLYYDVYRLLLKAYLNAGADNQLAALYEPILPEAGANYQFPSVPEVVSDRYPWHTYWPDAERSDTDLRVLVRTAVASRQRQLGRVDLTWVQEAVPGRENTQLQVTPEEVARFVAWLRIRPEEIDKYVDRLQLEQKDMRHINRVMQHIRTMKTWMPDAPEPPVDGFSSLESDDDDVEIELPPVVASGVPPPAVHGDGSSSSMPVPGADEPGRMSTITTSGRPSPMPVSVSRQLTTPPPSMQFPSRPSPIPSPGQDPITPYYEALKFQWQMESAEQASLRPPAPRPSRPPASKLRRPTTRPMVLPPRQSPTVELRWGKALPLPSGVNDFGRASEHPRFSTVVAPKERGRLTILECTRQFFKSYAYPSHSEPTPAESLRRDFLLAVLYAQFPTIEVFPPLYAFVYPFTRDSLLNEEKLEMPAVYPAEAWVAHWWDDQNRLLTIHNPAAHIPEPADILYDFAYQARSPGALFKAVLQTAQIYFSAHHGKTFRRHPESVVPIFRTPALPPALSPIPQPPSRGDLLPQDIPSCSSARDPEAFGPPTGSEPRPIPETIPKPAGVLPTIPPPQGKRGRGRGWGRAKALSLSSLTSQAEQERRPGQVEPTLPSPVSTIARPGAAAASKEETIFDRQLALRRHLTAEVERRDQEEIDFRRRLIERGVSGTRTLPQRNVDIVTSLLGRLPSDLAITPETHTTTFTAHVDLGGGRFRDFNRTEQMRVYRLGDHELRREYLDIRSSSDTTLRSDWSVLATVAEPPPPFLAPEASLAIEGGFRINWDSLATDMTPVTIRSPDPQTPRPSSPQ